MEALYSNLNAKNREKVKNLVNIKINEFELQKEKESQN